MFLSRRATQAEYFDLPDRSAAEIEEGYRLLARVNRIFHFAEPFKRLFPHWLGEETCRRLTILDLGAGDGLLGQELAKWAAKRGWQWRVVNLDVNRRALELNSTGCNVAASVTALPFADNSFDVVIATQMTHHLESDEDVAQHFREAWRVSRDGVFIYDLHRHPMLYALVAVLLFSMFVPADFRSDGLLSVRRGWRADEWRQLAMRAGIAKAEVRTDFLARVILQARKPVARPGTREGNLTNHRRSDLGATDLPVMADSNNQSHLAPPTQPAPGIQ